LLAAKQGGYGKQFFSLNSGVSDDLKGMSCCCPFNEYRIIDKVLRKGRRKRNVGNKENEKKRRKRKVGNEETKYIKMVYHNRLGGCPNETLRPA
jgi:hypothetical protein